MSVRLDVLIGKQTRELHWRFQVLERAGLGDVAQDALAVTPVATPEHTSSRGRA